MWRGENPAVEKKEPHSTILGGSFPTHSQVYVFVYYANTVFVFAVFVCYSNRVGYLRRQRRR